MRSGREHRNLFFAEEDKDKVAKSGGNTTQPLSPELNSALVTPVYSMFNQSQNSFPTTYNSQSGQVLSEGKPPVVENDEESWYESDWLKWLSGILVLISAFLIIRKMFF